MIVYQAEDNSREFSKKMEQLQMEKDDMSNRMKNLQDGSYNLNIIILLCQVVVTKFTRWFV